MTKPTARRKRRASTKLAARPDDELYDTLEEFLRKTKVSRATAWRMRKDGRLRVISLGPRLIRVPRSEYVRLSVTSTEPDGAT
jgi:hypothetical protein